MVAQESMEIPSTCPLCAAETDSQPIPQGEDLPCPSCGLMLRHGQKCFLLLQQYLARKTGVPAEQISASTSIVEYVTDSIESVELLVALEQELELDFPDVFEDRIVTIGDAVRALQPH